MPRRYDYAHDETLSDKDYIWSVFREQRSGRGEIDTFDLWGPRSLFLMSGPRHQFDLSPPKGVSPYDNALVDPVYRWLEENTTGPWHWIEGETNNNRSVYTAVYLERERDIEAFCESWRGIFKYSQETSADNAEWRKSQTAAAEAGRLPPHLTVQFMKHILLGMYDKGGDWLDGISDRAGFDVMFAKGFTLAVKELLEAEPGEWGPKRADGTWHEGVVQAVASVGGWVRERAPASLRADLEGFEIGDAALSAAFGVEAPSDGYAARP